MGSFGAPTLKYTVQLALMVSMFQLSDEPVNTCTLCGVQDLETTLPNANTLRRALDIKQLRSLLARTRASVLDVGFLLVMYDLISC